MDFKILFSLIKKNIKFTLIFTGLVIIATEGFSWYSSGGYDVSVSLSIFSKVNQATQDYQYDGYYNVKAADEFANTVSQWLKSPETVNAIYKKAGLEMPRQSLRSISRIIKSQKMAPQYVEASFKTTEIEQARKISEALISILQEKTEQASRFSGNAVFTILGSEPVIVKNQANFVFHGLIALIGGFLLAVFIILLREEAK